MPLDAPPSNVRQGGIETETTQMTYKAPHFGNLKARATKLGLIIKKVSTAEDAYWNGGRHEYVIYAPGENWENKRIFSLAGIRAQVEKIEARA